MKKILTLMLCVGATYFATAQSTREMEDVKDVILGPKKGSGNTRTGDDKDVILGKEDRRVNDNRYPSRTSSSTEEARINREYDAKIQSIRNNRQLSSAEKERAIRQLEADRNRKLRSLNERNRDRRYNDRDDDDDDRRYSKDKNKKYKNKKKGNNGKHLGWEKGKGNPHRNRD